MHMMIDGLISILMPVHNTAPFLRECLDSILRQTESNWELLAIDDFSTDNSLEVLQSYAQRDARIKVFQNQEKGIIPALRLAFQNSRGSFITRMDSDDRMMPRKLELLHKELQKYGRGHVCTGQVMYFSEAELGDGYKRYEQWLNDLTQENTHYAEIYKECVIPSPCWMVERRDLIRCGAFEPNTYPEDYDLCFRFYKYGLEVVSSDQTLHLWRDHAGRTSRNDPTYANQNYFNLKLPYFIELDCKVDRPVVVWGAGRKGKAIARYLHKAGIPFHWFCNNPKKWGIELYDTVLENYELLPYIGNAQIIVAVAAPAEQREITTFLESNRYVKGKDYYFFC